MIEKPTMDEQDMAMLVEITRFVEERFDDPDEAEHIPYNVFKSMLSRARPLSEKQRAWVKGVHEKVFEKPQYENLVSSGKVPRGKEVPTPPVLQNLPMRPPQRQRRDEE